MVQIDAVVVVEEEKEGGSSRGVMLTPTGDPGEVGDRLAAQIGVDVGVVYYEKVSESRLLPLYSGVHDCAVVKAEDEVVADALLTSTDRKLTAEVSTKTLPVTKIRRGALHGDDELDVTSAAVAHFGRLVLEGDWLGVFGCLLGRAEG